MTRLHCSFKCSLAWTISTTNCVSGCLLQFHSFGKTSSVMLCGDGGCQFCTALVMVTTPLQSWLNYMEMRRMLLAYFMTLGSSRGTPVGAMISLCLLSNMQQGCTQDRESVQASSIPA